MQEIRYGEKDTLMMKEEVKQEFDKFKNIKEQKSFQNEMGLIFPPFAMIQRE